VLERVLIDEAVEMLGKCARHFARAPRTRPIHQACHTGVSKALHPCAQCGIGQTEGGRDRVDMTTSDDLTDGLRATKGVSSKVCNFFTPVLAPQTASQTD